MSEWITTKEAGDLLGVNIRTIQRYVEKGKLKAKIISGKNVVKKDAIIKLTPTKQEDAQVIPSSSLQESSSRSEDKTWSIPEGYLLIDRSTLESLREQIKKLTDSMGEMQLTQKLLIEKGLNLKDENAQERLLSESNSEKAADQSQTEAILSTPIENVAKAHEEFFGKKDKKGNLGVIWIVIIALAVLVLLLLVMSFLANRTV